MVPLALNNASHISQTSQWNAAEWFGTAVGGSSWLLCSATALTWQGHSSLAVISCASWLIAMGTSIWLWHRRDWITPFVARLLFLASLSLLMPVVWYSSWDAPTDTIMPSLHWTRGVRGIAATMMCPLIIAVMCVRAYLVSLASHVETNIN